MRVVRQKRRDNQSLSRLEGSSPRALCPHQVAARRGCQTPQVRPKMRSRRPCQRLWIISRHSPLLPSLVVACEAVRVRRQPMARDLLVRLCLQRRRAVRQPCKVQQPRKTVRQQRSLPGQVPALLLRCLLRAPCHPAGPKTGRPLPALVRLVSRFRRRGSRCGVCHVKSPPGFSRRSFLGFRFA